MKTVDYSDIRKRYNSKFGKIRESLMPENETEEMLVAKMKESLDEGYDLLPSYYGWTEAWLYRQTREFKEIDKLYKEHFHDHIPSLGLTGTMQELVYIVNKSVEQNNNLLPAYYGWGVRYERILLEEKFAYELNELESMYMGHFGERVLVERFKRGGSFAEKLDYASERVAKIRGSIPETDWNKLNDKLPILSDTLEKILNIMATN